MRKKIIWAILIVAVLGAALAVPDLFSALSDLPVPVTDVFRRVLSANNMFISGRNVSLFLYDNNTFILYCYAREGSCPETVTLHLLKEASAVRTLAGKHTVSLCAGVCRRLEQTEQEWTGQVLIRPGEFLAFEIV